MSLGRSRVLQGKYRRAGVLGPFSSSLTLAWLATHRDRLTTVLLGGKRLCVLAAWDSGGSASVEHSDAEIDAIHQLVYGYPPTPKGWRIAKQVDDGQDSEARLLLAHDDDEQRLLIIWPADDDPCIHMVHPCGTCLWEGPCVHAVEGEEQ